MKHQNGNGKSTQRIRIEFTHPTACEVAIAGTFNDWRPDATQMVALGGGRWLKELALSPGVYEYRLVVDGAWMSLIDRWGRLGKSDHTARRDCISSGGERNSWTKFLEAICTPQHLQGTYLLIRVPAERHGE